MKYENDDQILSDYLNQATKLANQWCDKQKSKTFTQKYITHQLSLPLPPPISSTPPIQAIETKTALEIQSLILQKKRSYQEVIALYHKQKQEKGNTQNSLTWSLLTEPLESAKKIDEKIDAAKDINEVLSQHPLLGFVLSIKECIYQRGCPNTCGVNMNLGRVPTRDPPFIKNLRNNGAVLTCRGNVPQFLLSMESSNTIYGITKNPYDDTRTAGGSSGGEAVNILQGFCNASIGTDIAGSVRIPALFCGIVGFKPTTHRLSHRAIGYMFERRYGSDQHPPSKVNELMFQSIFKNQAGVLAKSVDDAEQLMRVLVRNQGYDNLVPPVAWKLKPVFAKRVGVVRALHEFEPCLTASRALNVTITKLEKKGYSFVDLEVDEIFEGISFWANTLFHYSPYLWETIKGKVSLSEELFPMYEVVKKLHKLPLWVVRLIRYFQKSPRLRTSIDCYLKSKNTTQAEILGNITELYKKLEKEMTNKGVSAILSIGLPLPAIKHFASNNIMSMCVYLYVYNFLRMPAGVVPVTKVLNNEQFYGSAFDDVITEKARKSMEGSKGLPMGVQVAGRPFDDEVVLAVMRDIEVCK